MLPLSAWSILADVCPDPKARQRRAFAAAARPDLAAQPQAAEGTEVKSAGQVRRNMELTMFRSLLLGLGSVPILPRSPIRANFPHFVQQGG